MPGRPNRAAGRAWSDGAVQNPLAKQRALLAMRDQAARWIAAYKADVVARGLGFTPEDVAAVEASHAARPRAGEGAGRAPGLDVLGRAEGDAPELPGRARPDTTRGWLRSPACRSRRTPWRRGDHVGRPTTRP